MRVPKIPRMFYRVAMKSIMRGGYPLYFFERVARQESGLSISERQLKRAQRKRLWTQMRPSFLVSVFFVVLLMLSLVSAAGSAVIEIGKGALPIDVFSSFLSNISSEFFGAALTFLFIEILFNRMMNQNEAMREDAHKRFHEADRAYQEALQRYNRSRIIRAGTYEWRMRSDSLSQRDMVLWASIPASGAIVTTWQMYDQLVRNDKFAFLKSPIDLVAHFKLDSEHGYLSFRIIFDDDPDYETIRQLPPLDLDSWKNVATAEQTATSEELS